jgi:uncharacterized protein (UPF0305 family)
MESKPVFRSANPEKSLNDIKSFFSSTKFVQPRGQETIAPVMNFKKVLENHIEQHREESEDKEHSKLPKEEFEEKKTEKVTEDKNIFSKLNFS